MNRGVAQSGRYWYLAFAQVSYTLKKHHRMVISRSIQNGWAFKMVVVSTGCAIAVDHALIFNVNSGHQLIVNCLAKGTGPNEELHVVRRCSMFCVLSAISLSTGM